MNRARNFRALSLCRVASVFPLLIGTAYVPQNSPAAWARSAAYIYELLKEEIERDPS